MAAPLLPSGRGVGVGTRGGYEIIVCDKKSREVTCRKRQTCMFHMFLSSLSRGSTCQSKWVRSFFGDNGFPIPSLLYSIDDNTYNAEFLAIVAFMKKKP